MSPDRWREIVVGMLDDIQQIQSFTRGMKREEFIRDVKTWFAASYGFVRLGEAVAKLPAALTDANPHIDWRAARKYRNFMVHVYDSVDPGRVFDTAESSLPIFSDQLRQLLTRGTP